jgi:hypothetical protein
MIAVQALALAALLGTGATDGPTGDGDQATAAAAVDAGPSTNEPPVLISARVSPDPSSIGDLLELQVIAAYPRGISVNVPAGISFAPLHLVSITESAPEPTGEGLRKVIDIELQHFDVGEAEIPAFSLTYVTQEGEVETVEVPAQPFSVNRLLANEPNPERAPDDAPISIEYPNVLAETIIYSTLATMAAGLLFWLLLRRWLRRDRPQVVEPPIPPHESALLALEALEAAALVDDERFAEHYLRLTEIAKAYIEGRFAIEALDRTTDELNMALRRDPNSVAPIDPRELIEFLQGCDLIKFARVAPPQELAHEATAYVRQIVERTRPHPLPAERQADDSSSGTPPPEGRVEEVA